ncbi:hypothetical protein ACD578_24620 [Microvirga sp. RSM25]|uniref:hypothetical protein n=1 Tax=Microvirga sp. RSM25 TaxID=3273802 RepID=UPI00384D538D
MTEQPVPTIQYRDDYADQAQRLARVGLSEEGLARVLGVPVYAIYEWIETKPEFAAAIEQGWVEFRLRPRARQAATSTPRILGHSSSLREGSTRNWRQPSGRRWPR